MVLHDHQTAASECVHPPSVPPTCNDLLFRRIKSSPFPVYLSPHAQPWCIAPCECRPRHFGARKPNTADNSSKLAACLQTFATPHPRLTTLRSLRTRSDAPGRCSPNVPPLYFCRLIVRISNCLRAYFHVAWLLL